MRAERLLVRERLMVVLVEWLRSATARRAPALKGMYCNSVVSFAYLVNPETILAWNVSAFLSNKCKREE